MPTQRGESVRVEGLRELQAALRAMDKGMAHQLQVANKAIAQDVTQDARGKAGGVKGGARLQRSIFAVATQRSAGVQIRDGGGRSPTAGALGYEFGGGARFPQFDAWRGNGQGAGYAVYPAIRDAYPDMPEKYADALDPLLRKAFPD